MSKIFVNKIRRKKFVEKIRKFVEKIRKFVEKKSSKKFVYTIGIHTVGIHTLGTKVTQKLKNSKKSLDHGEKKRPGKAVFRSSVRSHATHAIGELKK